MTTFRDFDCRGIDCSLYDYDCGYCMDCHGFFDDCRDEDDD